MRFIWMKKAFLYIFLFIIFFFLSTPAIILKIVEWVGNREKISQGTFVLVSERKWFFLFSKTSIIFCFKNSTWTEFLSPLFLMSLATVLPSMVIYASQLVPNKTISALNHTVMSKTFAYLLMMIIILPSAGFSSLNAMLESIIATDAPDGKKFRWNCLFPVNNGAFFVIYTLQSAILANTVEMLRIPELSMYLYNTLLLRSSAEYEKARKGVAFEFLFGVSYARFLLIFTMTVTYSHACPLIAPCGKSRVGWGIGIEILSLQVCSTWPSSTWSTGTTFITCTHPPKSMAKFIRQPSCTCTLHWSWWSFKFSPFSSLKYRIPTTQSTCWALCWLLYFHYSVTVSIIVSETLTIW